VTTDHFATRNSQTRIKHSILDEYAGVWAGIISHGLRKVALDKPGVKLDLVYLDCFAGKGRYGADSDAPDASGPVWGSPVLGYAKLLKQAGQLEAQVDCKVSVTGIAIDNDRQYVDDLVVNLNEALGVDAAEISQFDRSQHWGRYSVIHGDCRDYLAGLLAQLRTNDFLLAFVDPYGPAARMDVVNQLLRRKRTDTIIYFPTFDVDMKGGSAKRSEEERLPTEEPNLLRTDRLFGTDAWREIARDETLDLSGRAKAFADLYAERLSFADPTLAIKNIPLRFSQQDRPAFNIFAATRNSDGALRLNGIMRKADYRQHWTVYGDARAREEQQPQIVLFGMPAPEVTQWKPSAEEIASDIQDAVIVGGKLTYNELRDLMVSSAYTEAEIKKGLRHMRKHDRLQFEDPLGLTAVLSFS
jgi:three-Cys-motif partner protein